MHGFKSFADRSIIEFKPGITGIVGPNGCGKSNINDAIRWVLGEQSAKSLRGSNMSDVIFAGSEDRKAESMAEVTLVFDNSDHYIKSEYNEIEITRRLYREDNEAEYLLNHQSCRLKDIIDLMMDTGLGRDSLSIISQGNISSFADSRPEDRRGMFEEAAGVAKYKKRKLESIRKLERTTENLSRVQDITDELERQLGPLRRQKEKAEQYLSYKESLKDVEVALIVKEVSHLSEKINQFKEDINTQEMNLVQLEADETLLQGQSDHLSKRMSTLDHEVNDLQDSLLQVMDEVNSLESQRTALEAKRQYALNADSHSDLETKIEHAKHILEDLVAEYNDRVTRFEALCEEVKDLKVNRQSIGDELEKTRELYNHRQAELQRLRMERAGLSDQIENHSHYPAGVRAILKSAKSILGFQGVLGEMIEIDDGYENAISTSLGAAANHIVMKDEKSARMAISFLKKNKAGRATFLPMDTMKPRSIPEDLLMACQTVDGFLGVAKDFVHIAKIYIPVLESQLGNIIIAKDLESANRLSHLIYARYRVVSLAGDVVNVGGSMTGGAFQKQTVHPGTLQKLLENKQIEISSCEKQLLDLRQQASQLEEKEREVNNALLQKQITQGQLENIVSNKYLKVGEAKNTYESLTNEKIELDDVRKQAGDNHLITQLNESMAKRDQLTETIKEKRALRMQLMETKQELDARQREIRQQTNQLNTKLTSQKVEKTRLDTQISGLLERLNEEYKMTFEYAKDHYHQELDLVEAREEVLRLRGLISGLGNVNTDAIEQYQEVSERYETLNHQRLDLQRAQDSILKAIEEMDHVMMKQFDETFQKINEEFHLVFRRLFGGGTAKLKYTDPENLLETGIDIDVQPPGKAVQNISLFSGGEKALIALSGLFAILRARPVPMCILDEVEAALDQANVERFARFLKDFSSKTQFIVVTHRPGTMEQCDALYGATMQQKGVTRLVSVQLEDAKNLASEN